MKFAVLTGQAFIVIVVSVVMLFCKGIFSFLNSKTKYLQKYSSSLYFQSLSNNNSAIASLTYMAEEQEVKEALLGAFCLWRNSYYKQGQPMTLREFDDWVEAWLEDNFHISDEYHKTVDFEEGDAIRKLREKKLLIEENSTAPDGTEEIRYSIIELEKMLEKLDYDWDNFFTYNQG